MVRAWYMDEVKTDQRLPHQLDPPQPVDLATLKAKTGVAHWAIDAEDYLNCAVLQKLKKDHGYTYEDEVNCNPESLPNYQETIKKWFEEHIHDDEEIRLILEGSGYFDVRDPDDKWIRIEMAKGDMIILPAGIYHRFTLDTNNHVKAKRYFVGDPVWTPHNRPQEDHPARKQYVQSMTVKAAS